MLKSSRTTIIVTFMALTIMIGLLVNRFSYGNFSVLSQGNTSFIKATVPFSTKPSGTLLPGERKCADFVQRTSWELRPDNTQANHRVPTEQQISALSPWGPAIGLDAKADALRKKISGNFTGTTDEIIQWAACKWGIDVDTMRAQAFKESEWHQNHRGDWTTDSNLCPLGGWDGTGCYQSYGILQIKYIYNSSAWPMSRDDTAFNIDYMYARTRACYEGWTNYFRDRSPTPGYPRYQAGDLWGCIGAWYSGNWYDRDAISYINAVKTILQHKPWSKPEFLESASNGIFISKKCGIVEIRGYQEASA